MLREQNNGGNGVESVNITKLHLPVREMQIALIGPRADRAASRAKKGHHPAANVAEWMLGEAADPGRLPGRSLLLTTYSSLSSAPRVPIHPVSGPCTLAPRSPPFRASVSGTPLDAMPSGNRMNRGVLLTLAQRGRPRIAGAHGPDARISGRRICGPELMECDPVGVRALVAI